MKFWYFWSAKVGANGIVGRQTCSRNVGLLKITKVHQPCRRCLLNHHQQPFLMVGSYFCWYIVVFKPPFFSSFTLPPKWGLCESGVPDAIQWFFLAQHQNHHAEVQTVFQTHKYHILGYVSKHDIFTTIFYPILSHYWIQLYFWSPYGPHFAWDLNPQFFIPPILAKVLALFDCALLAPLAVALFCGRNSWPGERQSWRAAELDPSPKGGMIRMKEWVASQQKDI